MTREERHAQIEARRFVYLATPSTVAERAIYDFHDDVAAYRIRTEGIKLELLTYVIGIGAQA